MGTRELCFCGEAISVKASAVGNHLTADSGLQVGNPSSAT